ncbi:MAG: DUF1992 domain-containing protein [Zoogloeaceae bacterium]|jgi:hypothetical protein|nr:DUF1992 domain-containing protein [Zoogloeaceae bacterium]
MMQLLDSLAEQKISAAIANGALDALPGAGRALDFGDELLAPDETRAIYRVLKNSGFLPPEVEQMREAGHLREKLARFSSKGQEGKRNPLRARLLALELSLAAKRKRGLNVPSAYREKVWRKLSGLNTEPACPAI